MGNKVNPLVMRLGKNRKWNSTWFSEADYPRFLYEDLSVRKIVMSHLDKSSIAGIEINRRSGQVEVDVFLSRSGMSSIKSMDTSFLLTSLNLAVDGKIDVRFVEERFPDLNARLIVLWICAQIEKRIPFRRAMKMAMQRSFKSGAKGIKVSCSGRLGGLEIARTEWYLEGKVPLHTFDSDIDYAFSEALTTYGKIGVKAWIYKGLKKDR